MVDNLQKLVKNLGRVNNNKSSEAVVSMDSSSRIQLLLELDDITTELTNLELAVESVHKRLESLNNTKAQKTLRGQFTQILRREKEHEEIQAVLDNLKSFQTSASLLFQIIPM